MLDQYNEYIKTYISYNNKKIKDSKLPEGNKQYLIDEIIKIYTNYLDNIITYDDIICKINNIIILFL